MARKRVLALILGVPASFLLVVAILVSVREHRTEHRVPSHPPSRHSEEAPPVQSTSQGHWNHPTQAEHEVSRSLAELRRKLGTGAAATDIIATIVDLEGLVARDAGRAREVVVDLGLDPSQDSRLRALLLLLVGPYRSEGCTQRLLKAIEQSDGTTAIALVLALSSKTAQESFDREKCNRFWMEALSSVVFGERLFPEFGQSPAAPKSSREWVARFGPRDSGALMIEAVKAVRRSNDPVVRIDLLSLLATPKDQKAEACEAIIAFYEDVQDPKLRWCCLGLLAEIPLARASEFLETKVLVDPDPELRAAAALALIGWDLPGAHERAAKAYFTISDARLRHSLLSRTYRSNTEEMALFLARVVTQEQDASLRAAAVRAVGFTKATDTGARRWVVQAGLGDMNPDVRLAALESVQRLGWTTAFADEIRRISLEDRSEDVRTAAKTLLD
jgi:hypothetical protein